ncbi:hypothetical protein [Marixanthotalea marina]|uniref:hypothetical protein n=1 Tax=Marixanthotalea marina TaxID=2844359 RepID=UPI002989DC4E|nr:hypothetical protein [Marixanthotalea marina]
MHKYKRKIIVLVFFLVISVQGFTQCAMCRAVLESEEGQGAAKGINDGIVYLMAFPYILIAGIGYFIYRKFYRKKPELNK